MPNRIVLTDSASQEKLGNLKYGTFVTHVPNNPNCFYIKVDKKKLGSGLTMGYTKGGCVLLNIAYGSLRCVPGDARVTVLSANIELSKLDGAGLDEFRKWPQNDECE